MAVCVSIDRFLWDAAPICYLPFDGRHPGVGASASLSIKKTTPVESYVALGKFYSVFRQKSVKLGPNRRQTSRVVLPLPRGSVLLMRP